MPPHRGYTRPYSTLYNQFHHQAIKRVDLGRAKISHSHSAKKPRKYAQGGIGVSFALLTENDLAETTRVDIDDRKKAPDKIALNLLALVYRNTRKPKRQHSKVAPSMPEENTAGGRNSNVDVLTGVDLGTSSCLD